MLFGHCPLLRGSPLHVQVAGRAAEVFGVNRQLQEQELLAAEEGQEWNGQEHSRVGQGLAPTLWG